MTVRTLVVEEGGERLDRYLAARCPDLSRARLQALIEEGLVRVDGLQARPAQRVEAGQEIRVEVPAPRPTLVEPQPIPLNVVYEDAHLIVVDKPAGLPVHPGPGHPDGTLVNALLARVPDLQGIGGELRPGIVHRLDQDTSGLVMVAKSQRAHEALSAQLKERRVEKRYLALVKGVPRLPEGVIEAPVGRDPSHRQRMAVTQEGRPARTAYRVLASGGGYSLLEALPETGRTHQIRLHLAAIRHPIAGDRVYGRGPADPFAPRQLLHAWRLAFAHPVTGERLELEAPLPEDFRRALETLGIAPPDGTGQAKVGGITNGEA